MKKWRLLASKIYRFFYPIDNVTMYKKMGVKIGNNCKIMSEVMIDYSHYWLINIGNNITLAPRVHILAHDASTKNDLNYTKIGLVEIGDNVFVGAGSIIMPGVTIGKNSVIGAGSVVTKSIPENSVAAGNPCKIIYKYDEYIEKQKSLINPENCFDESYTTRGNLTETKKKEMIEKLKKHKTAFVE
jgi:maltose O-acetyltransferase